MVKLNTKWWAKVLTYAAVIIVCQSAYALLARLYFVNGGSSKWLSTISVIAGFPILVPYYLYSNFSVLKQDAIITATATVTATPTPTDHGHLDRDKRPRLWMYGAFYVVQGVLVFGSTYLYSVGLDYLPVSTSTLIASSQLAFNAVFSYFINSQKFTPFITNSLFLLTISSVLLVFGGDPASGGDKGGKYYAIGFVCTVVAQVGFGLNLTISEYAFRKVPSFRIVMNMLLFQGMVATGLALVGLLASGDWKGLSKEMDRYQMGKASYVLTLAWTAVNWQVMVVGSMGLVFEVSSVFSASVAAVGLPLTPILSVFIFHDRMSGVKVVAMVLAVWGFLSYVYQQYQEDQDSRPDGKEGGAAQDVTSLGQNPGSANGSAGTAANV